MRNLHKILTLVMLLAALASAAAAPAPKGQYAGTIVGESGHVAIRVETPSELSPKAPGKVVEITHFVLIYADASVETHARKLPAGTEVRVNGKIVGKSGGMVYLLAESITKVRD